MVRPERFELPNFCFVAMPRYLFTEITPDKRACRKLAPSFRLPDCTDMWPLDRRQNLYARDSFRVADHPGVIEWRLQCFFAGRFGPVLSGMDVFNLAWELRCSKTVRIPFRADFVTIVACCKSCRIYCFD